MIKTLEDLGVILSRPRADGTKDKTDPIFVKQWLNVIDVFVNNGDMEQAVAQLNVNLVGSDIVCLAGSLRSRDLIVALSAKLDWNRIVHNDQWLTEKRSSYAKNSFRHRILENLTERSFWLREFGADYSYNSTYENIAFVFHAATEHGSMSFHHLVPSELFSKDIPFGTAVIAEHLAETHHIFENVPFSNISFEHQADFMVAGCLFLGAREDHVDPELRTLGVYQFYELIATLKNIDANQMYAPSPYLCNAFGWKNGSVVPLGILGLAILAATPIFNNNTIEFANHLLQTLTETNKEHSIHMLFEALTSTTSWDTSMSQREFGPINSTIVSHFVALNPTVLRTEMLKMLSSFQHKSPQKQDTCRDLMVQINSTNIKNIFNNMDAPIFIQAVHQLFDVNGTSGINHWNYKYTCEKLWNGYFQSTLQLFDPTTAEKIVFFMQPYIDAISTLHTGDRDKQMQSRLMLETFNPSEFGVDRTPRKLKI